MTKLYVASSWRNERYPSVLKAFQDAGYDCYDFRASGFDWSVIDRNWENWTQKEFLAALQDPRAKKHYVDDFQALIHADALVLVRPCGNSAHAELGFMAGLGKPCVVLLEELNPRADLTLKLADHICTTVEEVLEHLPPAIRIRKL